MTKTAEPAAAQEVCFPSCDSADGRFLALATGELLETLADQPIKISFAAPADVTSFDIEVFDGDDGRLDGEGLSHWDLLTNPSTYTLFTDPNADGSDLTEIASFSSEEMLDNDWFTIPVATSADAAAPSGNFYYLLEIAPGDPELVAVNAFKVRSESPVVLSLQQQVFGFIATWTQTVSDLPLIYPNYDPTDLLNIDNTIGSTYDGTFTFFVNLQLEPGAAELEELSVWDGDLDRGDFDGANPDTDDPNTPNDVLPEFDINEISAFEGIAVGTFPSTGAPPDDVDPDSQGGFGIYNRRSPAIRYTVTAPDTSAIGANDNPSGNREWEEFRIATGPLDPQESDGSTARLEAGAYRIQLGGMDMNNLNAWFFGAAVLCQKSNGESCDEPPAPYLLGDLVWEDPNANQTQDPGEPGIPGVVVNLIDAAGNVIATTITDENGQYEFDVDSGLYTVEIDPANFEGATPLGAIGDFVWLDLDRDGTQDQAEPGIPRVEVVLIDSGPDGTIGTADDVTIARTQTDNEGFYFFPALDTALYYTAVDDATLPSGLLLTGGSDPSDTRPIFVDETFRDLDFGYIGTEGLAGVGDFVWSDFDNDGVQDADEPGIGGVTLIVKAPGADGEFGTDDDIQLGNATTQGGHYLFPELAPGDYQVEITDVNGVLDGYTQTAAPGTLSVAADEYDLTGDFGYFRSDLHSVADVVWFDTDRDGVLDPDESGLEGVSIALLDGNGDILATTVTDSDGNFEFDGLPDGSYELVITDFGTVLTDLLPTTLASVNALHPVEISGGDVTGVNFGWVDTGALEGFEPTTPSPTQTDTVDDENVLTYDFGYLVPGGSIGDTIYLDSDGDGVQDPGEPGIPGVTVILKDEDGNVVDTQVTDENGLYLFEDLPAGTYTVCVDETTLPPDLVPSGDPDGMLDNETTVVLGEDEDFLDGDFGYVPGGSIGDTIWEDTDGDGTQDPGEPGIPGVTVILKDEDGNILDTTVTDENGMYLFEDLPPGTYTICVDPDSLPPGYDPTGDPDGNPDNETTIVLGPGEDNLDGDFGYEPPEELGSIGDTIWLDSDGDGVQDPGEPGIPGVTVILKDATGMPIAQTVTDANGNYLFPDLMAGVYTVCVDETTLPPDVVQTGDPDGTPDGETTVVLEEGEDELDADFGYVPGGSIGDTIWEDSDGDGVQDPGEPGIPGVTVILKDEDGNVLDTQVTGDDGMYLFEDLPPGTYTICVDPSSLPPGYEQTGDPDGTLDDETTIELDAGEENLDGDFGYQPPPDLGSIGDTIWFDRDGDGVQDPGEPGIPGVTVILKNDDGDPVATDVTDADGGYLFPGLPAGFYTVCVDESTLPGDLVQTGDPDGVLDGETSVLLEEGENELDADFGYNAVTCTEGNVLDQFETIDYENNDGSLDWAGPWFENDPFGGGAAGGNVRIVPEGALRIGDAPDSGEQPSATRVVDLTDNARAQLRFDFVITSGADPADEAVFEVSIDGGQTFFVVETFNGIVPDQAIEGSRTFNLAPALGSELVIRFRIESGYGELSEYLYIDNLEVLCGC